MHCTACGSSIAEGSRFCASCGARIVGHDEERRVVTVVFADMVGFTSLSENRDPEQVKHLVDRCFQWLTAEIVGFGGRVDKIIGDAVLALFGAPVAHEDDAERAVRAALRMQEVIAERSAELGGVVRLRIGVNTGEVLTGALAAGGDYTAMGDVVNSANRLQVAAAPGEVLVGPATFAATQRVIPFVDRGSVPAKGREQPLHAFSARPPDTAPGERPDRTTGPMVGRDREVSVLTGVATGALADARACLLVLLGDAGMGKSRIAADVVDHLACDADALVLRGRCVAYGQVNPWWPLADALRGLVPDARGASDETVVARLGELVAATIGPGGSDREIADVTSTLGRIFGTDDRRDAAGAEGSRADVAQGFVWLVEALSRTQPVVLWLSDLHWADPVVAELVDTLLAAVARRPVAVLVTGRRSMLSRWSPPVGRFDTFALNLEALDERAVDILIDRLVAEKGGHLPTDTVRAELRERSGGNPLFLIELLALLGERPTDAVTVGDALLRVPDTLRGLVAARLDNLDPAERRIVDDAAVLGRRGRLEHLAEMGRILRSDDDVLERLDGLVARDLLRIDGPLWEFTSDVTREVAYGMLTKSDRARKHIGVAQWIEATHADSVSDGVADLLAYHYGQAAELSADLGTVDRIPEHVRGQALRWLDDVSERGERLRHLPTVEKRTTQGLALTSDIADPDASDDLAATRLVFLLRRARARTALRDAQGALDDIAAARQIAARTDDRVASARVLLIEGELARQDGDLDGARSIFADAVDRHREIGDPEGEAEALRSLGLAELFAGLTADAERTTSAALDAFRTIGRRSGEAWALQNLAWISFSRGRIAEAGERLAASLAIFEEVGMPNGAAWALGLQGFVRLAEGDLAGAEALQSKVLAEAEVGGERWAVAMMLLLGATIRLWTGRTVEAVDMATDGLERFRAVQDRFGQARILWPLARALAMRGEPEPARIALDDLRRSIDHDTVVVARSASAEDRMVLTMASASVEVHLGNPEDALAAMASLAEELGAPAVAAGLRGLARGGEPADDDVSSIESWVRSTLGFGAGSEPFTIVAGALLQTGNVAAAAVVVDTVEGHGDTDSSSAPFQAAVALVRAVQGHATQAAMAAASVAADERASYLDRAFAGVAAGLAGVRSGDGTVVRDGFEAARSAVAPTGDLLTRALVAYATARARVAMGADPADPRAVEAAHARLAELGTDAHGWVTLIDCALDADAPAGV